MPPVPDWTVTRAREFDSTLALLRHGYDFVSMRCDELGSDAFASRLGLLPVVFARGADAAAMFYHPGRFTRQGAVPPTTQSLLLDYGSVQRLDGDAHLHRRAMFLRILEPDAISRLTSIFREEWSARIATWERRDAVTLHSEAELVLCRAACRWAGVSLSDADAPERTREFASMIDGAGSAGSRFARGWLRRRRTEQWMRSEIARLRASAEPHDASPATIIARHRDPDGELLDVRTAAVELINLLRPTVAVAYWITFAALALHHHPHHRDRLAAREPRVLLHFAQEVRRYYPFFPMVGGRALVAFEWRGRKFSRGDLVMLDLYGTNHDPRVWLEPARFDPDRFFAWNGRMFDLVPQGGGDPVSSHRCPGENPAIALLLAAIEQLATGMHYRVPPQDLAYRMNRFPTLPASGFVMRDVRRAEQRHGERRAC